ncbi:MAG: HlyC/CorC family transporter [Flavobacteriaceae bacterium]|nr:HlyC/CorC family transporter [Flavobacteriaceae bacterium]MBT3754371.1 HlyC/CorC family transporter [Flavobacteriaceae bacterium]MBT3794427.1 HlyC/CorC family transporter [Flavobacteriaceae bacterium]MBT4063546.1 HlyC/CorC family transporter [Flavobacteriaceae bacterium]MBT4246214.1 HlyC/CorC family transporter [Flavobacteriaceae bacterium]
MISQVVVIIISIFFSAFFSGMEIAFISSNKIYLEIEKKQGGFIAFLLKKITRKPSKFIATMLLGNNVALVVYGIYSGQLILDVFFPYINTSNSLGFIYILCQTIISTLVILITAEFLPKVLFQIYANSLLKFFSFPAYLFYILLSPITFVLNWISNSVLSKYFKTKEDEMRVVFSKDELGDYINQELGDESENNNIDSEIQIFQNALEFSNVRAREAMIPRAEIISVDRYVKPSELNQIFIKSGLSKILIHRENIDNVVGYVSLMDMFKDYKNFKSIIHPVEYIPESMFVNDLLNLLTKKRKRIAVVIDEYGGTSGIITIEDIIEELFGEIEDEHDSPKFLEKEIEENLFLFSARLEVDYLNDKYKLNIPESDQYETLGGFIVHNNQDIPLNGDILKIDQFEFKIKEVTNTKIETIELKILN